MPGLFLAGHEIFQKRGAVHFLESAGVFLGPRSTHLMNDFHSTNNVQRLIIRVTKTAAASPEKNKDACCELASRSTLPWKTQGRLFLFFSRTSTFQLLDKPWPQVSSLLPPGSNLQFYRA